MNEDDPKLRRAILDSLTALWDEKPVVSDGKGDRIFVRYVDQRPGAEGWDEWHLAALVQPNAGGATSATLWTGEAVPDCDDDLLGEVEEKIAGAVTAGESFGRFEPAPELTVWWCRSAGDGPPGARVDDWTRE